MRAGLPQREPEWLARWERLGVYDRLRETAARRGRPSCCTTARPTPTAHLHIGHALNKILKDFVVRSPADDGPRRRYVPGWDCHGLPIEWKIEEQYRAKGQNKDEVPVNELRAECRRFAEHWVDVQREEFKRLGVTGDWDDPYLTMDFHAEAVIADEFMKFVMNGTLYRGSKPVMWSPVEKTALAEAEVEYHDHQSHAVWVKFPVRPRPSGTFADAGRLHRRRRCCRASVVVIWTTTPWTIPSEPRVAFNPELAYGLYRGDRRARRQLGARGDTLSSGRQARAEVMEKARGSSAFERLRDVTRGRASGADRCRIRLRGARRRDGDGTSTCRCCRATSSPTTPAPASCTRRRRHGADDYELGRAARA